MLVRNLLLVVLALSSVSSSFGEPGNGNGAPPWWDENGQEDLLKCPGKQFEDKHYDIDVDVGNLPDGCNSEQLVVIGWLIEDAIQDMEEHQPEYQGEKWTTSLCPLPEVNEDPEDDAVSRFLAAVSSANTAKSPPRIPDMDSLRRLGRRKKKTYTYSGSGKCRRCKTARRRTRRLVGQISSQMICSKAETALLHQDLAAESTERTKALLDEVMKMENNAHDHDKMEAVNEMIQHMHRANSECANEHALARSSSQAAARACGMAKEESEFPIMLKLMKQADGASTVAKDAADRAERYVAEAKQAQSEIEKLSTIPHQDHRDLSSSSGGGYYGGGSGSGGGGSESGGGCRPDPFGVDDIILIDADTNAPVVSNGKYPFRDCLPFVKPCFGGSSHFNIKATTYGEVNRVHMSLTGGLNASRFESIKPFALFSDDGYGNYNGMPLPNGNYVVSVQALNDCGESLPKSFDFTISDVVTTTETVATTQVPNAGTTTQVPNGSTTQVPNGSTTQVPNDPRTQPGTTLEPPENIAEPARRGETFASLVAAYIGLSSVECIELNKAIEYRVLVEKDLVEATGAIEKIRNMGSNYSEGSAYIRNVTEFAEDAFETVEEVTEAARQGTNQTESYCLTANWASTNERRDTFFDYAKGAAKQVGMLAAVARQCVDELRSAHSDMSIWIEAYDFETASTRGIEKELWRKGSEIFSKIAFADQEIESIETKMEAADAAQLLTLGRSRDSMVEKKEQLEGLLTTNEDMLSTEVEYKKHIVEEENQPNYEWVNALQFIISNVEGVLESASNWGDVDETEEEQWFSEFALAVVMEIPDRLLKLFNTSTPTGCIEVNSTLDVTVVLSEKPEWQTYYTEPCMDRVVAPDLGISS